MKSWVYAITASLTLVIAGLVHGFWTDRWGSDTQVTTAVDNLAQIPMKIGEWEGTDLEVKPGQVGAGVAGCVQRSYFNRRLGATVVMALVNGRPGPVATHTPEACYGASGYAVGKRKEFPLDNKAAAAQFWTADAVRTRVTDETRVRLYWAWNGGEGWTASPDARQQFSRFRYPVLHKLYVLRELNGPSAAPTADEPCVAFLEALVPALDQALFTTSH
ncbi:MAG: exosortase-associated EpsI family protein [Gemmataceae bacterium]